MKYVMDEKAKQRQHKALAPRETEALAARQHHQSQDGHAKGEAVKQHGVGVHALGVKRFGAQRIKTVTHG